MKFDISITIYHTNGKIYKVVKYKDVSYISQVNSSFEIEYKNGIIENYPNDKFDFVMSGIC